MMCMNCESVSHITTQWRGVELCDDCIKLRQPPQDWTSDDWSTPVEIVRELEEEFGPFQLDPCCRPETAKAEKFYTLADDGLSQRWSGRVWLNPPYSDPGKWLRKAIGEVGRQADLVVALIPAATDTRWFHDHVLGVATEVRFRKGRIKFIGWMGTPIGSPKSGSVIAIYRAGPSGLMSPEEWADRFIFNSPSTESHVLPDNGK